MIRLLERERLEALLGNIRRSPMQKNVLFGADCELIALSENRTLATTTDTISEEIAMGLYRDPYTMGWVCATASLSDLAAVGANPLGLLLSSTWSSDQGLEFQKQVMRGFCDAAELAGTFLLGGDSSGGIATVLTSTGVGICENEALIRTKAKPGDLLVLSGKSGIGPALAYGHLLGLSPGERVLESRFRPSIKLEDAAQLGSLAHAMIDTSDGILAAVTTLCSLNECGARLCFSDETLDDDAIHFCKRHDIPLWALWVAEHGDYQLLGCISPDRLPQLQFPGLHIIGEITSPEVFEVDYKDRILEIDPIWSQLVAQTKGENMRQECQKLLAHFRDFTAEK